MGKEICPFCRKEAKYLGEEEDCGMNHNSAMYCEHCDTCYNIKTGPDINEWCEELMTQLGINVKLCKAEVKNEIQIRK